MNFKLHAPKNTTFECELHGGRIVKLEFTPASREKDVEIVGPIAPLASPPLPVSQGKKATASSVYLEPGYEADKAFDGDPSAHWRMDSGQGSDWLEIDLGEPTIGSRVVIQEQSYPQTTRFAVEAQQPDGSWKTLSERTTIGDFKELKVATTTAQKFLLHLLASNLINAGAGVTLDEVQRVE